MLQDHPSETASQMAALLIGNAREGQPTLDCDLRNAGFTADQVTAFFPAAKRLADQATFRQVHEDVPVYDRESRVRLGAALIVKLLPSESLIFDCLKANGFATLEIGDLWPDVVTRAGQSLATTKVA